MADGTLNFDTKIDSSGFNEGAGNIGSIMKGIGLEKIIEGGLSAVKDLGKEVIQTGMSFESAMSQVGATMGLTSEEIRAGNADFELLSKTAKEMGATTMFSASEAAEGLNYLALAGLNATESAELLPKVLDLAASGGIGLADASDMVTDSMAALGIELKDADKFVNQMAKTAQKSNTSVAQLGEATLTVGGTAKIMKGGITEMNTVLGVLADNGTKGSEAGTKLRNIITSLTAPTDTAADAMRDLGLEVFDAEGNMRGMPDIMQDLNDKLSQMTVAERQNVINKIFNKADLKDVNALLATSKDRWNELSGEIEDSNGAASDMADTMQDNLKGALTSLNSALEGLMIELYEVFAPGLQSIVELVTGAVQDIVKAFQEDGVTGAIQAAGDIVFGFIGRVAEAIPDMISSAIDFVSSMYDGFIAALPNIIAGAQSVVQSFITKVMDNFPVIQKKGYDAIVKLANGILQNIPAIISAMGNIMQTLIQKIVEKGPEILQNGINVITQLAQGIISNIPAIVSAIARVLLQLIQTIISHFPQMVSNGIQLIGQLAQGMIGAVGQVLSSAKKIVTDAMAAITGADWLSIGTNIISSLASGIKGAVGSVVDAAKGVVSSAIQAAKNLLGIHSPSRVFRWMGEMSSKGLGLGFEENIPVDEMSRSIKNAINTLQKDMSFTTTVHGQSGSVAGITKARNDSIYGADTSRMIALQEEANKNMRALANRPIYLGSERIDRQLPKGAVPVT